MTNKNRTDIGIIASVTTEAGMLRRMLRKNIKTEVLCYEGSLSRKHVVLTVAGIGKVNAAHAVTRLIHEYSPKVIMNIGIGGAYPSSRLRVGDIAIAEQEIYGDEGALLKDGFHGLNLIGIPILKKGRKKYFNEFPLDNRLAEKLFSTIPLRPPLTKGGWGDFKIKKGIFLTVSSCTGTKKRAFELERRFGSICENMEGAAIAHVCTLYGIPMVEIRGISNIVGDRDRSTWDIRLAAENCQKAMLECIQEI